jgi:hypothetical protein
MKQATHNFRVRVDNLSDTLSRKSFLSETSLDIIHHFSMRRVRFVQNVPEVQVRGTQAIAEVLSKHPTTI